MWFVLTKKFVHSINIILLHLRPCHVDILSIKLIWGKKKQTIKWLDTQMSVKLEIKNIMLIWFVFKKWKKLL